VKKKKRVTPCTKKKTCPVAPASRGEKKVKPERPTEKRKVSHKEKPDSRQPVHREKACAHIRYHLQEKGLPLPSLEKGFHFKRGGEAIKGGKRT